MDLDPQHQPGQAAAGTWRQAAARARRRALFLGTRWALRRTGFAGARPLGAALGNAHFWLDGHTRRRCLTGLAALVGGDAGDPRVARLLREAYRVNTTAVLEVLSMVDRRLDAPDLHRHCHVEGVERLEAARTGRGAILLATHSGNSLLLAAQLADAGWPVSVVYRHTRMMSKQFFAEGLPRYGFDGILANEGFRAYARMVDALRSNRVLFAMMDQGVAQAETGIWLRFLGKDMPMPGGVVQASRQTRAPILPVITHSADPVWRFSIESPLVLSPGGAIEDDCAAVLRHTEATIRERPELWSWPHRRWRNYPVAACSAAAPVGPDDPIRCASSCDATR